MKCKFFWGKLLRIFESGNQLISGFCSGHTGVGSREDGNFLCYTSGWTSIVGSRDGQFGVGVGIGEHRVGLDQLSQPVSLGTLELPDDAVSDETQSGGLLGSGSGLRAGD